MFNLEGKNAFISGASRGLGRQFANALAKAGANVVITSRTLESLESTKQEIEAIGRKCINIKMEVLEEESIIKAVKKADKFVQRNPVLGGLTGLAAYDIGKGIFSKIMNLRGPGVRGGTVGRRSAGTFTAT